MIIIKKKKEREKRERDLNTSKNVMSKNIVIKEKFHAFYLICLTIFV